MRDACQVQNPDGSHRQYLSRPECERKVKEKVMRRMPRTKGASPKYRMIQYAQPSDSDLSMTTITLSDMQALVGIQKSDESRIERLIGFGLLPENTRLVPRYL